MYWIINKNIEFWPENKRLISLKNPAQSVTLTAPASHCLVLLLEATPELVSQQVFFKKVWEDEGILVPANTLYQNISIVRRGLRDVGETDNSIVVTVPRKGFHINPNVNVERMDEKPLNSETYNNITIISQDDVAEKIRPQSLVISCKRPPEKHRCKGYNVLDHAVKFTGGLFVFSLHLAFS